MWEFSAGGQVLTNRREFLGIAASAMAGTALIPDSVAASDSAPRKIKAIAFDAFTIFDPRSVAASAESVFPGRGTELVNEWRTRQFEYTWLRTLTKQYANFWQVTEDALVFASKKLGVELSPDRRSRLMNSYLELKTWPDLLPALKSMRSAGLRLAFLSNFTDQMLEAGIRNNGLDGIFELVLSTDRVQAFKPDPRAYQVGISEFKLQREEVLFAAFAGWDAVGAKVFGYPTFWLNRQNAPAEELGVTPDAVGASLTEVAQYALR
jgi:2-haloacid dehalogenase